MGLFWMGLFWLAVAVVGIGGTIAFGSIDYGLGIGYACSVVLLVALLRHTDDFMDALISVGVGVVPFFLVLNRLR